MSFLFRTLRRSERRNSPRNLSSISCCSSSSLQASDDQTNGVKIVRKKNAPIDLTTDLVSLSNSAVSQRLKLILEKLENSDGEVPPHVISKNIQYALELLQQEGRPEEKSSPTNESEEIVGSEIQDEIPSPVTGNEEGNELSQVDEEVIPEEVRQWLASTFTKNVPAKTRSEGRPRFRSVANAIRVGLFVDRFYRQQSSTTMEIPSDVGALLKEINNWQFDIFTLHEKSGNRSLRYVAKDLFSRYGLLSKFRINLDRLDNFLAAVELGYTRLTNPYHNDIHASDVTQTLHFFISSSGIVNLLTDLEIFSLLFAALIHDFEHTGRTNNFHINTATDLSLIYNDRSVLENHHVSAAFRLLRDDDKNILSGLKSEEYREFRNLVIEMVLSTDMSGHFTQLKTVKAILSGDRSINRTVAVMNLLLHCADISHPGKPWKLHKKFADLIIQEFFLQGDEESRLGLPFSPLCDRKSVLVPESQISFIEFIVEPSLGLMSDLIEFSISAEADGGGKAKVTRRADSEKSLVSDVRSRFSSSQGGPNKPSNGPILRPWINHLQENKAKWRMISAETSGQGKMNSTEEIPQSQSSPSFTSSSSTTISTSTASTISTTTALTATTASTASTITAATGSTTITKATTAVTKPIAKPTPATKPTGTTASLNPAKTAYLTVATTGKSMTPTKPSLTGLIITADKRRREFQTRLAPFTEETVEATTTFSSTDAESNKPSVTSSAKKVEAVRNSVLVRGNIKPPIESLHPKEEISGGKVKIPPAAAALLLSKGVSGNYSPGSSLPGSLKGSFDSLRGDEEINLGSKDDITNNLRSISGQSLGSKEDLRDIGDVQVKVVRKESLRTGMLRSQRSSFDSPRPSPERCRGRIWERQSSSMGNRCSDVLRGSRENLQNLRQMSPLEPSRIGIEGGAGRGGRGNWKRGNNGVRGRREEEERIKLLNKGKELSSSLPSLQDAAGNLGISPASSIPHLPIPSSFIKTSATPLNNPLRNPLTHQSHQSHQIPPGGFPSNKANHPGEKNPNKMTTGNNLSNNASQPVVVPAAGRPTVISGISGNSDITGNSGIPTTGTRTNSTNRGGGRFWNLAGRGRNYNFRRGSFNRQLSNSGMGSATMNGNVRGDGGRGGSFHGRNRGPGRFLASPGSPGIPGSPGSWAKPGEDNNKEEVGESSGGKSEKAESPFLSNDQKPGNPKGNKGKSKRNAKK